MPRSRVTIRDVAAHAGVSHQTVSRVINGESSVRQTTRARVEASIAELGFQPNAIARSMARGRTSMLACIAPNLTDYTFASIIDGAETAARDHDYFLLAASAPDESVFAALVEQLVTSRRVEGLIVLNPYADGRYQYLPAGFPTVLAGARPREDALTSVSLDDVRAGEDATAHLLTLGHHAVATITGPMAEDCSQDRLVGYQTALHAAGVTPNPALIVEGDWSADSGYAAFQALQQCAVPPTAVFAQNDQMAFGLMRAAAEQGRAIPHDLSVIGVDNIPMAPYAAPPLTTMNQDFSEIGRRAAHLLRTLIERPSTPPQHERLPSQLIIRHSTDTAAPNH